MADVKIFGRTFFDNFDFFTSNLSLPVGGLVVCAIAGYKAWPVIREEISRGCYVTSAVRNIFRLMVTIACAFVFLFVLVTGLM